MPTENERICDMIPEAETCDQALDMIYDKHFIVRLPSQSLQSIYQKGYDAFVCLKPMVFEIQGVSIQVKEWTVLPLAYPFIIDESFADLIVIPLMMHGSIHGCVYQNFPSCSLLQLYIQISEMLRKELEETRSKLSGHLRLKY